MEQIENQETKKRTREEAEEEDLDMISSCLTAVKNKITKYESNVHDFNIVIQDLKSVESFKVRTALKELGDEVLKGEPVEHKHFRFAMIMLPYIGRYGFLFDTLKDIYKE